ncbi:hypothetical protein SUNI508_08894 [Seiridium unicorne]|uniref:Antifreeze protein n=1 Tax=Seiridium unicorne TaxID=138068 RepID=A0ABR2USK9_9PEZI
MRLSFIPVVLAMTAAACSPRLPKRASDCKAEYTLVETLHEVPGVESFCSSALPITTVTFSAIMADSSVAVVTGFSTRIETLAGGGIGGTSTEVAEEPTSTSNITPPVAALAALLSSFWVPRRSIQEYSASNPSVSNLSDLFKHFHFSVRAIYFKRLIDSCKHSNY